MTVLYLVEPDFFRRHLNGARIPMFLHMLGTARRGVMVEVLNSAGRARLHVATDAPTMDAAFASVTREPPPEASPIALAVVQKGQPRAALRGLEIARTALMLNDPRARQAANQLDELRSGRFGFDPYRLSAPLRYLRGLRQDRADMQGYDIVYVQSEAEAAFLERKCPRALARIEVFKNSTVTLELFPGVVTPRGQQDRPYRFLLPVPPGVRREAEYAAFLRELSKSPQLLSAATVLADAKFARHVPKGVAVRSSVDDFQTFLRDFDCVVVPTKHYTGVNNRVFQAACAGCHLIASPEALVGLMPGHPALAEAPRTFKAFRQAMIRFPEGALAAQEVLGR